MNLVIAFLATVGLALVLALILLIRKVAFQRNSLPVTAEWIDELSVERYRPMMRLLDGDDFAFLKTQPGFTPRMAAKLRRQRCQIFSGYLQCLNGDFARVCSAIKLVMLHSQDDRPDLATALLRQQAAFTAGMLTVYFRLSLYRLGLGGVDVARLMTIFDGMRLELRTLLPSAVAMGA